MDILEVSFVFGMSRKITAKEHGFKIEQYNKHKEGKGMKKRILTSGILVLVLAMSGCGQKSSTTANTPLTGGKKEKKFLSDIYCKCGSCNETLAACSCPQAEKQKKALGL